MTKDNYDYAHDYDNRGHYKNSDPTGLVIIGVIYGLFQLTCWLCGQFWFWTILLPIAIATPAITWYINGFIGICFCTLLAMLCVAYLS